MPDYSVVILIVALITVAIIVAVVKGRKASAEIAAICLRRGWANRAGVLGFGTVSGLEQQVGWVIEHTSSTNRESRTDSSHVTIKFKLPLPRGESYLVPVVIQRMITAKTAGKVLSAVAKHAPSGGMIGNILHSPTYEVSGLTEFVGSGDKTILNRLINPQSASAIRSWPSEDNVNISIVNGDIEVTLSRYSADKFAKELEKIQSLAAVLIRAGRS